jgi:NifB/MoaA-like Fe-S oxidoreductase
MVADFLRDAARLRLPATIGPRRATLVTGLSFAAVLRKAVERLRQIRGLTLHVVTVPNRFFGPSVTVAGLLAGSDILHSLRGRRKGDIVFIPADTLTDEGDLFLDGMGLADLRQHLGVPVVPVRKSSEMLAFLRENKREAA